jgi:hypothetical protein
MMESNVVSLEMAKKLREMQTYYVFSDGRVYSTTTRMFLKPYINGGKPNQRYLVVRLQENTKKDVQGASSCCGGLFTKSP